MSTLDEMTRGITAGVMQRKANKATKLTPVKGEGASTVGQMAARIPDVAEVFLTNEAIADIATDLRKQAEVLITVAEALEARTGKTEAAPVAPPKSEARFAGKDPEPTEQQKFDGRMKELSAAAQAATFAAADDGDTVEPVARITDIPAGDEGYALWVCPKHGVQAITTISAKGGRKVRVCDKCDEVEPA